MGKYNKDDIVYLLDDVTYNDIQLKRGQEFFVIREDLYVIECFIDGSDDVYIFSDKDLTDKPSDIPWSKDFIRVRTGNILMVLCFILILAVLFVWLFNHLRLY